MVWFKVLYLRDVPALSGEQEYGNMFIFLISKIHPYLGMSEMIRFHDPTRHGAV